MLVHVFVCVANYEKKNKFAETNLRFATKDAKNKFACEFFACDVVLSERITR